MVHRFDLHERLGPRVARVVPGPFTERTLDDALLRVHPAFDDDLGVGGQREAGDRSLDDAERLAAHAAGPVILGEAELHLGRGREEQERVAAGDERDRHLLAARDPGVTVHPTVLARRDVEAELVLVVDHHPVAAEVDPAVVLVAGDVEAAGADVATAVVLVPLRRRENGHVDVRAALHVLEDRAVLHLLRGDRDDAGAHALLPGLHQVLGRGLRVEAKREGEAREPAQGVGEDPEALLVTGDLVEEEGRRAVDPAGELGRHADLIL